MQPRQRQVTFSPKRRVRPIPIIRYTPKEAVLLWYSPADIRIMKREYVGSQPVRKEEEEEQQQQDQNDDDEEDEKSRLLFGLSVTKTEMAARTNMVEEAQLAVFTEQTHQWDDDVIDVDLLADVYFECTKPAQWQAKERGRLIALEVKKLYRDNNHNNNNISNSIHSSSHSAHTLKAEAEPKPAEDGQQRQDTLHNTKLSPFQKAKALYEISSHQGKNSYAHVSLHCNKPHEFRTESLHAGSSIATLSQCWRG
jgi:hypothetical protein